MWRVPVQTKLSFMQDLPVVERALWERLKEEDKRSVIETLARLIAKMVVAETQSGADIDDR
jgi:hypothetical protein